MAENFPDKFKESASSAFGALREPEGIATAALGAFLINPLVGLALGVGQGILARRDRQSALDVAAFEQGMLRDFEEMHQQAIAAVQGQATTETDQLQLQQLTTDFATMRKMAMHPDPAVRQQALQHMAEMSPRIGTWLEDLEGRQEAMFDKNVAILDEQGVVARQNFERGLAQAQTVQRTGSEIHQLLSDPNFDVNNPVSRARLGQLMDQTPREFLADPADMSDALEKVGANVPGIIGGLVQYYAGKKKAEEFTFTKEDWRKVAHAMLSASETQAKRTLSDAERIGVMLDRAAGGMKYQPALSYLDRIMTGKVQEGADLEGRPGVYDEATRAAAQERAAAATAAEAANPSKASRAVATAKEKATSALGAMLDPTGYWRGLLKKDEEPSRRPTN